MRYSIRLLFLLALLKFSNPAWSQDITIVDIGLLDRLTLGKELRIINNYSPKVVGLDFFLLKDSLSHDSIIVKELNRINNYVAIAGAYNYSTKKNHWDSLKTWNAKFGRIQKGFSNLVIYDSVMSQEFIIRLIYKNTLINSFSYEIAMKYKGVKEKYSSTRIDETIKLPVNKEKNVYKIIRADDLLKGNFKPRDIRGKIVLMGYIGEYEDQYYLDEQRKDKINGIEIHALYLNELMIK